MLNDTAMFSKDMLQAKQAKTEIEKAFPGKNYFAEVWDMFKNGDHDI